MNLTTLVKLALCMRRGNYGWAICVGAGVLYFSSCAPVTNSGVASPAAEGAAGSYMAPRQTNKDESAMPWSKPSKERPGLATGWGDSVHSPMTASRFERASKTPVGVDAIYYNNQEGLQAMGALDRRVGGMQEAAGGIVEWGVKGGIGFLPAYKSYASGGYRRYVQGANGAGYSIVVKNRCKCRVQVVLSVDGLDVLDGKSASVSRPGYVIEPGKTLEIKGFRTSYSAVAAFKFSGVSQSYANLRHGDTRNVGVIGLAVYTERGRDPWTWMPSEVQQREGANPFATQP